MVRRYSQNHLKTYFYTPEDGEPWYELMVVTVTDNKQEWSLLCKIHGEFIHINKNNGSPKCPDC